MSRITGLGAQVRLDPNVSYLKFAQMMARNAMALVYCNCPHDSDCGSHVCEQLDCDGPDQDSIGLVRSDDLEEKFHCYTTPSSV